MQTKGSPKRERAALGRIETHRAVQQYKLEAMIFTAPHLPNYARRPDRVPSG
jgi:hypothetical protein